ncbi:MAG: diacylglycerol/lipid kinase family protein, partial [Janthinobacterium lividum]
MSDGGAATSIALVVNPAAAKGRAQTFLPEVAGRLRDAGHAVEIAQSRTPAEAAELVAHAAASGADVLAVMGGDGMAHLGVNAVAEHAAAHPDGPALALGLIPAGTGNDLARSLGLDPADLGAATAALASGATRAVDLLRVSRAPASDTHRGVWGVAPPRDTVDGRWVGTVLATGFDALVNARANRMHRPRGAARYTVAALAELRTFRPLPYALVVDGVPRDLEAMLVAVGNTSTYGGGLRICPAADPYDGWLDVTVIHPVGRTKLLQLLPQMRTGRFASDPCVEQLRARTVSICSGSGCTYGDG